MIIKGGPCGTVRERRVVQQENACPGAGVGIAEPTAPGHAVFVVELGARYIPRRRTAWFALGQGAGHGVCQMLTKAGLDRSLLGGQR
jgi:hypothetical protein